MVKYDHDENKRHSLSFPAPFTRKDCKYIYGIALRQAALAFYQCSFARRGIYNVQKCVLCPVPIFMIVSLIYYNNIFLFLL